MTPDERPEKGTRLTAVEIHDNILEPARHEMRRPAISLLMSALASGLVIGFSFLASAYAAATAAPAYAHAAASAAYPLGFIFVVMARSELFTENTLTPVIPFLEHRDRDTFVHLVRMWALLLIGNLVGAVIFAWTLARTGMVETSLQRHLMEIAQTTTEGGFGNVLYAGVFAGWLIALLSWLLASTQSSATQVVFVWLCTAPISALHFRHSIAGAVEAFYRAAAGNATWGRMFGEFVAPAVIGNAIGGVILVALLNYGQVAADKEEQREGER
ncbi:MAG TPA: formate/nitrite transporter family protein [Gemmatimonadales bacterium]|nr:formate/nitrite transporter family protein [Gemmatimonadales bacterium]